MFRRSLRTILAALIIGLDVVLLVLLVQVSGWLEASESRGPSPTPWPTATPMIAAIPTPTPKTVTIHTVRSGEVLAEIAKRYGLSVQDIMASSNITDANRISVGQPLTIPVDAKSGGQ